jgi:ribosomal protein L34
MAKMAQMISSASPSTPASAGESWTRKGAKSNGTRSRASTVNGWSVARSRRADQRARDPGSPVRDGSGSSIAGGAVGVVCQAPQAKTVFCGTEFSRPAERGRRPHDERRSRHPIAKENERVTAVFAAPRVLTPPVSPPNLYADSPTRVQDPRNLDPRPGLLNKAYRGSTPRGIAGAVSRFATGLGLRTRGVFQ